MFDVHGAIRQAIGEELRIAASSVTGVSKPTADLAAYMLYQQGRHHFQATPGGFAVAKQCYEQAIARDPRFALAYDAPSELYWYLGFLGFVPPKEVSARGMFYALRALEIDNTLAETHALFGMYRREIDSDSEMMKALDRARELRPWSSLVKLRYATAWLFASGRIEEAIGELEGALERDPLAGMARTWLGVMFWLARKYDRAIEQARLVVEIEPASYIGYWLIGMFCRDKGTFAESIAAHRTAVELSGGSMLMLGWHGLALGQSGNRAEARALLDRLHKGAVCTYVPPSSSAWTYLGLGDIDNTFFWMNRAADARDPMLTPIQMYPFLDPLRQDPRYVALLQKLRPRDRPPGPPEE